jgi:phosphoglycerate dehydrogenase-like enzyme
MSLPPTQHTTRLINQEALSAMRPNSFVVNIGRGSSLDESALQAALSSGHLCGAALDVFSEEPLPLASPLWSNPRVLLTPHSAGVAPALWPEINKIFIENLLRSLGGEPLQNIVNKERGY